MDSREYQELFQLAPDPILVLDASGAVLDANDEATRFLGYPRDELIGLSVVQTVAPEDRDESTKRLRQLVPGASADPVRRIFMRKDGSRVPGEICARVLSNPDGSLWRTISVIRDASRSVTDERMRDEQAARLQALGSVASGVAHDFNNILATIIGYSELAREQVGAQSDIARDLDRSIRAADQAQHLVEQILAFGRQADGTERAFDVEQAIVAVTRLVRSLLPAGTEFRVESDHSEAVAFGDMARFQQVILNLCSNAGRALGDRRGTVRVSVRTESGNGEKKLAITVSDDGPGVPEEIRDRIFEPFFSTRSGGSGTGLGLSLVRTIVESFGGTVVLDDTEIGASFTVRLPAADGVESSSPAGRRDRGEAAGIEGTHGDGRSD
jgi:PAS domain S-box-containing protein